MRYFLEVRYLGTHYFGWQIQPRQISIQEHLENGLSRVLSSDIKIHGSSRTDTGVHARQQFAHFDIDELLISLQDLKWKLNSYLPRDIAVMDIIHSKEESHSRFDAASRKYIYRINLQKEPFMLNNSFYFRKELNVSLMNEAAVLLLINTDFECFSKVRTEVNNFKCHIQEAEWKQFGHNLEFHIKANRFLRGMVRAIVGTLLDVGQSKISVGDFQKIIDD